MNKRKLQQGKRNFYAVLVAFISLFLFGANTFAREFRSGSGKVIGTNNSRMAATIVESENGITLQVVGIGKMTFDAAEYAFFINQSELVMSDKTFTQELKYSTGNENHTMFINNIDIAADLKKGGGKNLNFEIQKSSSYREAGEDLTQKHPSSVAGMDALIVSIFDTSGELEIPEGEMNLIFTCYLKKKNPGRKVQNTDIGVGVKVSYNGGAFFCPKWVHCGLHWTYATNEVMAQKIVPELFTYRSPSSTAITGLSNITFNGATVKANFKRGNMSPANNLLDGYKKESAPGNKYNEGRLNWDEIVERGFIYTEDTVEIFVKAYSNILLVNGNEYPFPSESEIAAGKFIRDAHTFYIVSESNTDNNGLVNYSATLKGLSPKNYSVWPYIKYVFETSQKYPYLGSQAIFNTEDGTYIIKDEPASNNTTGKDEIQKGKAKIAGYYTVLGVRLPKEPRLGVYIILYEDGTTEKRERLK